MYRCRAQGYTPQYNTLFLRLKIYRYTKLANVISVTRLTAVIDVPKATIDLMLCTLHVSVRIIAYLSPCSTFLVDGYVSVAVVSAIWYN